MSEGKKHVGKYVSWDTEKAVFLPSIRTEPSSITSSYHMSLQPPSLQTTYITQLIPHPTGFNPKDGGSIYLQNVSIHLQDHSVSQLIRQQSEGCGKIFTQIRYLEPKRCFPKNKDQSTLNEPYN